MGMEEDVVDKAFIKGSMHCVYSSTIRLHTCILCCRTSASRLSQAYTVDLRHQGMSAMPVDTPQRQSEKQEYYVLESCALIHVKKK